MRRERVVAIDDREHAGAERDLLSTEPVGLPAAVPVLVMVAHEERNRIRQRAGREERGADDRILLDALVFVLRERSRLVEHRVPSLEWVIGPSMKNRLCANRREVWP